MMMLTNSRNVLARSIAGIRVSALVEIASFLAIALAIDRLMGDGERFIQLSPHPFWFIILLIIVQYGVKEALLAAFLSSACLLVNNIPVQQMAENSYDYTFRVIETPVMWITAATLLGAIRTRHLHEKEILDGKLMHAKAINETITHAYQQLKIAKDGLELRLAEEQNSSIVLYEAAKALETIDQRKLLKAVKNIVSTTLNPAKFSLYALRPTGLESITCHGWEKQDTYVLAFPHNIPLTKTILEEKRVLCVVNEEDEAILASQGVLAGPIIDSQTGEIFGMLKIEETGVLGVGMRNVEIFKVLCEWIGMAYANARKYQQASGNSMLNMPVGEAEKETVYNARTSAAN